MLSWTGIADVANCRAMQRGVGHRGDHLCPLAYGIHTHSHTQTPECMVY